MSDPLAFASLSPRFSLPLLHAGQAQKELHVNEAHALTDALLHCVIEGESAAPPASPTEGTAWLVAGAPTGDWSGQAGKLACRQSGQWLFVVPRDGMRLFDRDSGQEIRYLAGWIAPGRPAQPSGGSVVDVEARTAISALIATLEQAGIIPSD
jgi:hypothetical protein